MRLLNRGGRKGRNMETEKNGENRRWAALFGALVGLMLLGMGLPAGGAVELDSKDYAYAVIFAVDEDGDYGPINEGWALHNWLIDHGWLDSHITFLADHDGADGPATKENLRGAIEYIANHSSSESKVFISVMDHESWINGHCYIQTKNGLVSVLELRDWINDIAIYKSMTIELSSRYSGAFIEDLSGEDRLIVTSHTYSESYTPNHFLLSESLSDPAADTSGDGFVSVQEAFAHQANKIQQQYPGTQTPQIEDSAGTVILDVA